NCMLTGSVEVAPRANLADAICDLVSSGATLQANNLKEVKVIYQSRACLIQKQNTLSDEKQALVDKIMLRVAGVMQARESKYIMLQGAFAMFCGKLSDNDTTKLYHEILDNIAADSNFKANMQKNMLFLANGDYISMLPYLDENGQKTPLNLIFETIIAKNNNLNNQVDVRIAKLRSELPQDIVANILYFNSLNSNLNIKEYAQNAQIHFKNLQVDYRSVFGGSNIARELYVN
ncbi:hypothetical protein D272_08980, partial [Campylobacter coli CVM N29716]